MSPGDTDSNEPQRLSQAISSYISIVPVAEREAIARELGRFARWIGSDILLDRIAPVDIARYQEQFPESSVDVNGRLEPVKAFLTSLKTKKLTAANLGAHIRLRRPPKRRGSAADNRPEPEVLRVTEQGFAHLTSELEHLETVIRPQVTEELGRAFLDKDFRENAPYDAAKQKLAQVQGRIDDIRGTLMAASIYVGDSTDVVDLGTTVTLHSIVENEEVIFTIVGPGEVSPRDGKISLQSPVGKALVDRRAGEVVEVQTPAGAHTYRIERIERRS